MSYFDSDNARAVYPENSRSEELLAQLSDICLSELMASSDAYICMIKINLQGYKRLHRRLSKKFQDLYLEVQHEAMEKYGKILPMSQKFDRYNVSDLKEHLTQWTELLKSELEKVNQIIKEIFETNGYICCVAEKVQKLLYKNIIKNERTIQKFEDCEWSKEAIYIHDKCLHDKIKQKEC